MGTQQIGPYFPARQQAWSSCSLLNGDLVRLPPLLSLGAGVACLLDRSIYISIYLRDDSHKEKDENNH
jgi:hypothetical protein